MYLNGAVLDGVFPVSAIAMSVGLNVTLTSYGDSMHFGFVGNGATMHDLPSLALDVQEAYEELKAAIVTEPSSTGPRRRQRALQSGGP
jgi:hypothetical protein